VKTRMLMRLIILAVVAVVGIALTRATPVQGKKLVTSEMPLPPMSNVSETPVASSSNSSQTPVPPAANTSDDAAIRVVYQQILDGWNKSSGTGFAAAFTEDADLVGFDGTHLKGRKEIASFHQKLFDTFLKGSRLEGEVKSARFLSPDVAVVHAISRMPGQITAAPERDSIQTLVFTKRDGQWHVAGLQNTRLISTEKARECGFI